VTELAKAQAPSSPWADPDARAFLLRKLFSLTGVVPVAGFTLFHLWKNATALQGRDAFTAMAEEINAIPYVAVFEVAFILLPILLHALFGILIVLDARYNVGAYRYSRNWMFTLQRAAGLMALIFLVYHLYELRFQKLMGNMQPADFHDTLCASLSSTMWGVPVIALLYVLGIAAIAFHLANGLWGFLCSWGITVTRRSQRISASLMGILGLAVFALGANTTVYFATGSKLFVPASASGVTVEHCPGSAARSDVAPAPVTKDSSKAQEPSEQPTEQPPPAESAPTNP
jgi:succinate dehydrogenase/fumarate reductase cytochrome b subunit (b558 family)